MNELVGGMWRSEMMQCWHNKLIDEGIINRRVKWTDQRYWRSEQRQNREQLPVGSVKRMSEWMGNRPNQSDSQSRWLCFIFMPIGSYRELEGRRGEGVEIVWQRSVKGGERGRGVMTPICLTDREIEMEKSTVCKQNNRLKEHVETKMKWWNYDKIKWPQPKQKEKKPTNSFSLPSSLNIFSVLWNNPNIIIPVLLTYKHEIMVVIRHSENVLKHASASNKSARLKTKQPKWWNYYRVQISINNIIKFQ